MEKIEGDGLAFAHAGGYVVERELKAGEILKVDTGCVVAYTAGVDFDIEFMVRGIKNFMFGGEGLFFAVLNSRDLVKYGCNLCPSAAWQDESCNMVLTKEKKKEVF
jgi:hypothetical protein